MTCGTLKKKYEFMICHYKNWIDEIIEEIVIENFFDFNRALIQIKMEFEKRNIKILNCLIFLI